MDGSLNVHWVRDVEPRRVRIAGLAFVCARAMMSKLGADARATLRRRAAGSKAAPRKSLLETRAHSSSIATHTTPTLNHTPSATIEADLLACSAFTHGKSASPSETPPSPPSSSLTRARAPPPNATKTASPTIVLLIAVAISVI
jgi:hypothetical protein